MFNSRLSSTSYPFSHKTVTNLRRLFMNSEPNSSQTKSCERERPQAETKLECLL